MPNADRVVAEVDAAFNESLDRLKDFLAIPSVGTDPAYHADTRRCAEWLVGQLRDIGLDASLRETPGMPVVVAHGGEGRGPRLLYYGHYDVQPADPLELWESPPFEPVVKEGKNGPQVVARGAVDDKGQVMTIVEALRAWKTAEGRIPLPITLFIEGEEEGHSANLEPFMRSNADELRADVCIISDTGMLSPDRPAVTTMLRGMAYVEATLHGPSRDLHSGMYGGAVPNPINELCRIVAALHDDKGRVTLENFYDRVVTLPDDQIEAWRAAVDEAKFLAEIGLKDGTGEAGYSTVERVWARPTLDCNGIWGGYTGEGSKTVIPAKASAKISCRLVPDQDPAEVGAALRAHFERHCPPECRVEVKDFGGGGGIRVEGDNPYVDAAKRAAAGVFPEPLTLIGCGGSIPVVAAIKQILDMDTMLLGFGLDDDRIHSPNEKFDLVCFERGIKTHARLLAEIAGDV